ncbi:MAG: hypothetical protein R2939_05785 [Kofleriaceae bacterium]
MTSRRLSVVVLLGLSAAAGAHADDDEPGLISAGPRAEAIDDPRDHARQFGLAMALPFGLRAVKTYDGEYCGDLSDDTGGNAPACVGRASQALDFIASYGVLPRLEALLELRVGLERDPGSRPGADDGPRVFHLSPGVRVFYSDARTSKLFSTGQAVFDFTGNLAPSGETIGADVGVRNVNGLWFDRHAQWGWYLFVGETLTFTRWLRFELEGGIGIQGRLP